MWDGILNGCAAALYELAKLVGDWGLAIIIVTLIIRLLLFPIQRKQLKSSFQMQQVQPRMQEIQSLYAGDQVKIQQEMQKLYQETGFNPLAGCLPMLIQTPIFIILFQVLRDKIGQYAGGDLSVSFYNILPNLTQTVPDAFNQDIVYAIPYIVMMVLFIGLSVTPMILQMKQNPQNKNQMVMMMGIMGIMFTWMAFISPAGVMLYWALSSGFALVQQLVTQRVLKKEAAEKEEIARPVKVNVERREKKKRPTKKH